MDKVKTIYLKADADKGVYKNGSGIIEDSLLNSMVLSINHNKEAYVGKIIVE